MANAVLICEGVTDVRVLDKLIAQKLGKAITILAAGGDRGLRSVAAYERQKGQYLKVVTIEDRNYKSKPEATASWAPANERLIWHRHEIENYLLKPEVVLGAITNLPKHNNSPALPTTVQAVEDLLKRLAATMLEDHAGRLTYHHLVEQLNPLRLKLAGLSRGVHSESDWLIHLNAESSRLDIAATRMAQLPELQASAIKDFYTATLKTLNNPTFLDSGQFLEDLQGKELLNRLYVDIQGSLSIKKAQQPNSEYKPKDTFREKLIESLGQLYEPGYFYPDDFDALANRL